MDDPIMIDAHDIRFSYDGPGGRRSLNGAQLHVSPGEFVAVLGHNGCGKSTLVKHFNALLPLQHGTLTVDGMDAADPANRWALRRKVGMVFQNPDNQFVSTIVGEDVAFGLENYGVPEAEIPARVAAALAAVDMAGYENRATHTLSGGQKQRVALAGVLALSPDILVFDEATAMLDPRGREQVMQTIHHLNKDLGITVVSITHYMEEAAQADRVLVMSQGNVVMEGTPKEVFSQTEKVRSLRLDVPQAAELRDELVKAGIPMPEGIIDTGECAQALYELLK
jgi:energy-coupling factor transport system ATP-binding protein